MTLQELRSLLRDNLYERNRTGFVTSTLNAYVNAAMQHVSNWIVSLNAGLLVWQWQGTITNTKSERRVLVNLSSPPSPALYPKVRRIIEAERYQVPTAGADTLSQDDPSLEIIDFSSARLTSQAALTDYPPVFMYNETLGFVAPSNNTQVRVFYSHGLSDMIAEDDTPGQSNGVGEPNRIPVHFQILIPTYAAVLGLAAENNDASQWQGVFGEQKTQLLSGLSVRRRTPEQG